MAYHIASDERVVEALQVVFTKYRSVSSQCRLKELVETELKTNKKRFHVTGSRVRLLVIKHHLADVEIHSREGDPHKILNRCPVCNGALDRVKNQTIWGGQVTLEFRCQDCGYWTGKKKRVPTRYVFHQKK